MNIASSYISDVKSSKYDNKETLHPLKFRPLGKYMLKCTKSRALVTLRAPTPPLEICPYHLKSDLKFVLDTKRKFPSFGENLCFRFRSLFPQV